MISAARRLRNPNDLLVGVFLIAVALLSLWLTRHLSSGSATSMGPGYVPRLLCFIQIVFGLCTILQGLLIDGQPVEGWKLRPLLSVLVAVAFFSATIDRYGVVVAVIGLVVLSTLGYRQTKWLEAIALALFMALFTVLTFVKALELPVAIWPSLGG